MSIRSLNGGTRRGVVRINLAGGIDHGTLRNVSPPTSDSFKRGTPVFATTHWSVVLAAGGTTPDARAALAVFCRAYWYPLYAFVRRSGQTPHDAQDLTQEFFARLIAKEWLGSVAPERGRFRSWLLASMKHFLANEWRDAQREKRGGGAEIISLDTEVAEGRYAKEPVELASPERLYDRRWALDLLDRVLTRLGAEWAKAGKADQFDALRFCLTGERTPLADLAVRLRSTEGAVKVAVHRLRERYRELIRAEITETVAGPDQVEAELAELLAALRG